MIKQNLIELQARITECCKTAGRDPSTVKLVGVSKMFPVPVLQEAYEAGLRIFGENKPQEFRDKLPQLPKDIEWHLIGRLQGNKAKYVVGKVALIHSIDSVVLANDVNNIAGRTGVIQKVLIEVNTSGEDSKIGLRVYDKVFELASEVSGLDYLKFEGLMTIGPNTQDKKQIRQAFINLRKMAERLKSEGIPVSELSMGMTQDYDIAIEEGATIIRIGTALFGGRNYN